MRNTGEWPGGERPGVSWYARIVREQRGINWAVIDYLTTTPGQKIQGPGGGGIPEARPPKTALRVGMVVTSWGRPCGVAEYTRSLVEGMTVLGHHAVVVGDLGQAARTIHEHNLNLVHVQYEYSLYDPLHLRAVLKDLQRCNVRLVATAHSFLPHLGDHNLAFRQIFLRTVVHSEEMRREMAASGIPVDRLQVIPMGARKHPLSPREEVRLALGLGQGPVLGYFGFAYPHKGIQNLALAAESLRERYPGLRCLILASAAPNPTSRQAFQEVHAMLDARGLGDVVKVEDRYLPEAEVVRQLSASDLVVLPYAEYPAHQISAAVRTAMAAGRPVITTRTIPFSDLNDEVYKVPDNRPETIARGVQEVLENHTLQEALVSAAFRYLGENTWPKVAARHLHLYGLQ